MKKEQKQQAEALVALLAEAHAEIEQLITTGNMSAAMAFLAQCQECAFSLSTVVEAAEGEQATTLARLREYCEEIYRIYQVLDEGTASVVDEKKAVPDSRPELSAKQSNCLEEKLRKDLQESLDLKLRNIENSVKNDIKVRKIVVFLPYKASMWDSLESVWKAADEDPDCDAYVVPIPYYDKNPGGSFKEFHYEGDLYPDYVPVTDYRTFSLAEHKPDTIFIHNPYDDCNYVTSIHPQFYSARLKEYTDKLVYIPYFVLGDIDPENEEAVEGMAHFCTLPGVLNADKVIVQSEDMRQAYIKVLLNFVKGSKRAYWEERILGLGSPKLDKVQNTRREDLVIPEEWLRIIEKPDGSWKKIILYNTSVSALLKHDDKMLVKMRDVFRIFYENRDDVALLWRPHPLIKATIESMRPQLWKDYEKIVAEYREAGWGIYDDTAELDRAIGVSDAYYGDNSSLVQLCKNVGMLIMIQNVEIREVEEE